MHAFFIEVGFGDHPVLEEGLHGFGTGHVCRGHLQVHAAFYEIDGIVGGGPVGHHDAFKAPFAEVLPDKPGILCGMHPVDGVIAGHDGADTGLFHRLAEGREIDFIYGTLVGIGAHAVAVVFLLIEGEMLDGGHNAFVLHTLDIAGSCFAGEVGILPVILEIASAKG